MACWTIKAALAETLEDLRNEDLKKFCSRILDRREERPIRRARLEGKDRLEVTDVLVSHYKERGALKVALETLELIGCSQEAENLAAEAVAHISSPSSSNSGPGNLVPKAEPVAEIPPTPKPAEMHLVDRYREELTNRVSNMGPILDKLLKHEVIQQESYSTIRRMSPPQAQMRELLDGPVTASKRSKDVFVAVLKETEKYLYAELLRGE